MKWGVSMGKKSDGKGKGSQLVIRIDKAEREAFVALCERLDTSAAREIRRFMRGFVAANGAGSGTVDVTAAPERPAADTAATRSEPDRAAGGPPTADLGEPVHSRSGPQPS
jgi:hypothetical protein